MKSYLKMCSTLLWLASIFALTIGVMSGLMPLYDAPTNWRIAAVYGIPLFFNATLFASKWNDWLGK